MSSHRIFWNVENFGPAAPSAIDAVPRLQCLGRLPAQRLQLSPAIGQHKTIASLDTDQSGFLFLKNILIHFERIETLSYQKEPAMSIHELRPWQLVTCAFWVSPPGAANLESAFEVPVAPATGHATTLSNNQRYPSQITILPTMIKQR